jgi:UDP-glucose/galactose:(glucosyl)LPS alpha-1,2-glucosyl/galactosyltransferase
MMDDTLVIVSSCDERYILPLTVMVRSLLENLARSMRVDLYILQDNVSATSRHCAEDSWKPFSVRTQWITPGKSIMERISKDKGFAGPPATYFRLFIEELLPAKIMKAIYLDADILVLGDLSELWNLEMSGSLLLAVQDAYARAFHLGRMKRVAFRESICFDSQSSYFNAGVLVIDLAGWRKEAIGKRALQFMKDYKEKLTFCDQDALNCVLQK